MKAFKQPIRELGEYEAITKKLKEKKGITQISGCIDSAKAVLMESVAPPEGKKLVVTYSEQRARELLEEYRFFTKNVAYYPARDVLFYQSDIRGNALTSQRIAVAKLLQQETGSTIITTFDALMDKLIPPEEIAGHAVEISWGQELDIEQLQRELVSMGYEKNYQAEAPGQFAVRGGILDIFPLTEELAVRVEMFGDEVDALRIFDPETQCSIENIQETCIYPATEVIVDRGKLAEGIRKIEEDAEKMEQEYRSRFKTEEAARIRRQAQEIKENLSNGIDMIAAESYIRYFYDKTVSFLEYFDRETTTLFIDEPARAVERGRAVELEFNESMEQRLDKGYCIGGQADILYPVSQIVGALERFGGLAVTTLDLKTDAIHIKDRYNLETRTINPYNKNFDILVKDLKQYKKRGYRAIVVSGSKTRAARLAADLQDEELSCFYTDDYDHEVKSGEVMVCYGKVKKGYEFPLLSFAVISESDIFGTQAARKKKKRSSEGERIRDFAELHIGDYVIHENHGLGVYRGIEKVEVDRVTKDYIKIEYDKGGVLYIQASSLDMLQKYSGSDAKKPKLNRLGTQEWNKTKQRVRGAVKEIAQELVQLYAARESIKGFVYGPDTVWQKEFEEMFPFEETTDQERAIEETKRDMESEKNMDRLICGDVGFGKTEIAIRAAFKAVQEGKQVVYLVPTTILAQQHYNTFTQRMKDFPVRVDLLCRFRTAAQQKKTVEDLKKGQVDIVIGTHRVLSKDVQYKDLGLLIIDEEQRFGVAHKEKIKQLKNRIDVLTLTATPIPRTLHMSLVGIKDMSILEEAPIDRQPVQTYVMEFNEEMVREAITRELARGGQVYYVYNRVNNIEEVSAAIKRLVPDAEVAFAHGQMRERELENIMYRFINGEIDVLVSTTIIETGLDISNVNTMIIQDADNLGLSQLYQLRGRVGRSNRTAYAFLMYKRNKLLKEVAEKRLSAIREFTELGSGFKIAMKDLEIRGAGNLLGADQHGHMEAVGYDLYCKMLNEAIRAMKGQGGQADYETVLDLNVNAFIPNSYIPNEYQKLDIYKRIASVENEEDRVEMETELIDRFGDIPASVTTLLEIACIRHRAHEDYFTDVVQKGQDIKFVMYERAGLMPENIPQFVESFHGAMKFVADAKAPYFVYNREYNSKTSKEGLLDAVRRILGLVEELLMEKQEENL